MFSTAQRQCFSDALLPPVPDRTLHLALGNLTPKALLSLEMIAPFGIALPDS
eukprot:CAMPEP_0194477064 /NCGR_PEP_ID=MMETSP0253-20130528/852_1 /TAXON_ID=2966 /ORGANISM="Noctiluca scintillans" /LENGTH=51 /DNA_ID=CAMNT_0039315985 /DNA_START=137 /DNA_END=289 /DNA_ORIENTATION=-